MKKSKAPKPKHQPADIKTDLRKLILNQGIVLEHQVYSALTEHFTAKQTNIRPDSRVSLTIRNDTGTDSSEIDVYFGVTVEIPSVDLIRTEKRLPNLPPLPALTFTHFVQYFAIECKGHPNDGVFLARQRFDLPRQSSSLSQLVYYGMNERDDSGLNVFQKWKTAIAKREVGPVVDWMGFYRYDANGRNRFIEDKDKAFKALLQSNRTAGILEGGHYARILKGLNAVPGVACSVLRLICTNAPLRLLHFEGAEIEVTSVPWLFVFNSPAYVPDNLALTAIDELVAVVHVSALTDFCERAIDLSRALTVSKSQSTTTDSFPIAIGEAEDLMERA